MCDRGRLLSNGVLLAGHSVNVVCVLLALKEGQEALRDKRVTDMKRQMFIYITIWNIIFQITYLLVNMICEAQEVYQIKDRGVLGPLKVFKRVFFDSIMVPTTFAIVIIFWPMFNYDRELIYPAFIDDAIGARANYMMHAYIVLVAMWEMRYMSPKEKYRGLCLVNCGVLCALYMGVLFYNHGTTGLFPYPILYMIYGTIYFPTLLGVCVVLIFVTYHVQWPLRRLLSIHQEKKMSNKVK